MEIKAVINNFFIRNSQGFQYNNLRVPCEAEFPAHSVKQQVCFISVNNEICFDLINYNRNELREFKLLEGELISREYLKKLSVEFSFEIINHPLAKELLMGVIPYVENDYGKTSYGAIRKFKDQYYFTIYSKKGYTNFEDNFIFIYGIWEVKLPSKVKLDLFGKIK